MQYKDYKVNPHNSTVCGYPGRDFDWNKFCWDGTAINVDRCQVQNCDHKYEYKAPLPFVDSCLIAPDCQYLHVPYDYAEVGTIFRVRPNDSMYTGEVYRGHKIVKKTAIKKRNGWYWRLQFES